jgi:hypothetical protein
MAKLTVNHTPSPNRNVLLQGTETKPLSLNDSFLVDFQEFLPNLYVFRAKDYTRELLCEMTLELKEILLSLEEEGHLAPVVACSFPSLSLQKLNEKVGFDGYLQRMLMVQFHLKILEQLLLFCEQQDAANLILTVKDADSSSLEIYRRLLVAEEPVNVSGEEQVQVVIPVDGETYDKVIDFMDKIDREFRCALWRGQSINPIFREYLKSNACL